MTGKKKKKFEAQPYSGHFWEPNHTENTVAHLNPPLLKIHYNEILGYESNTKQAEYIQKT